MELMRYQNKTRCDPIIKLLRFMKKNVKGLRLSTAADLTALGQCYKTFLVPDLWNFILS
jgi:hypothetical protein